ncbi:MAG: serine/threonine-protein kinase, partial [Pseudomonadota bacterium]
MPPINGNGSDGTREALFLQPETMVDHFRVVRLVGRGGMGEVYLARDSLLNRRVALKVIHPRYLDSEAAVARFMREAQLTASMSHPHIVTIFAVGKHEGRPYLALEYLEGQNLRQRMEEERPGVRESLRIVLAMAQALAEAHRHRVLHRDLKPENVILAKDGRLRLVDLGLAMVVAAASEPAPDPAPAAQPAPEAGSEPAPASPSPPVAASTSPSASASEPVSATVSATASVAEPEPGCANVKTIVTAEATTRRGDEDAVTEGGGAVSEKGAAIGVTAIDQTAVGSDAVESENAYYQVSEAGTVQGTPAYMAPEQWRGEVCSEATDIWALGTILHELLTGERPYQGQKMFLGSAVTSADPVPLLSSSQDVPIELVNLVACCLEKAAAKRPPAIQIVETLEQFLAGGRRQVSSEESPFRGLFPFSEHHADLFFGRDHEIAVFLESLREQAVLPVVGPSGAGKSSFVQAGVLPRLREQGAWLVLPIRPGADPFGALAARLAMGQSSWRITGDSDSVLRTADLRPTDQMHSTVSTKVAVWASLIGSEDAESLAAQLRRTPATLGVLLHEMAVRERSKVLLFVDQFEETFTMVADRDVQESFLRAVCGVADHPSSPVRAVFTIRDDFLGHLGGGSEVAAALARVFVLRRPGKEALAEVLTRPLSAVSYSYDDPALPPEMVASVEGEPACLPLLQFAGQMLWERRDRSRRLLCRATYEAIGGVAGSLAEHADGILAGMTTVQVELARQLLLRLVTSAGTRRVVPVAVAVAGLGPEVEEVLTKLTRARLLTVRRAADGRRQQGKGKHGSSSSSSSSGGSSNSGAESGDSAGGLGRDAVLELVHESLLRTWGRLARWIDESHEELAVLAEIGQAAELWHQRGRRIEEVWQGDALADARRKLTRLTSPVPERIAEFINVGLRKEQRRIWRKRALAVSGVVLLAAVTVASLVVAQQMRRQRHAAQEGWSRAQQGEAEAQREGANAAFGRGHLVEARARLRSSLETQDSLLGRALYWKLNRDPLEWTIDIGSIAYDVAYAPDGRSVAVACHDGVVYLVDVETTETRPLRGDSGG